MPDYVDFSGRNHGTYQADERPETLARLCELVQRAERSRPPSRVHAVGERWASSAPAFCPGLIVDMGAAAASDPFPADLQQAVTTPATSPPAPPGLLVSVAAGVRIRNLYRAIDGTPLPEGPIFVDPLPPRPDGRSRRYALPTQGGAGKQTLAGALTTGTHGGDVGRGPISNYVHAIVVVGSGGAVRLMQRAARPVVDFDRLHGALRPQLARDVAIENRTGDDLFRAAVVSVGRFGVVWAYVLEIHDETDTTTFEFRRSSTWAAERATLGDASFYATAAAGNEFYGLVMTPVGSRQRRNTCTVTRQLRRPGDPDRATVPEAGSFFDRPGVASTPVLAERAGHPLLVSIGQAMCADRPNALILLAADLIDALGFLLLVRHFPAGFLYAIACRTAAMSLRRISPDHRLGDAAAEVLNLATQYRLPQLVEILNDMLVNGGQPSTRGHHTPWIVHGTRWQVSDFFDYTNDCFRGDFVEVFFPVDAQLPEKVEAILDVFARLRDRGVAAGAYIALRVMSPSDALIAPAAFGPFTCSIEVSFLRGLEGNDFALIGIQDVTAANGGRLHWGQQNDRLTPSVVNAMYAPGIDVWRRALGDVEGPSLTFSNPFSVQRNLEPARPAMWGPEWTATGMTTTTRAGVVSAGAGRELEVFALDTGGVVNANRRPGGAPPEPWRVVRSEARDPRGAPTPIRAADGRIELFVRDSSQRLSHCWEEGSPGGPFSGWDVKWGSRIVGDPTPVTHADGRLEVFAVDAEIASADRLGRALHCYARWVNGPWSALEDLPLMTTTVDIAGCLRSHVESVTAMSQLVAVAPSRAGVVMVCAQVGPRGDSGWTDWRALAGPSGAVLHVPNGPTPTTPLLAVDVYGPEGRVHVLAIDLDGQLHEAVEANRVQAVEWENWRPLPAIPGGALDPSGGLTAARGRSGVWLFVLATSGELLTISFDPIVRTWGSWVWLGGAFTGAVAAGTLGDGTVEVFARRREDDHLMARRQQPTGAW